MISIAWGGKVEIWKAALGKVEIGKAESRNEPDGGKAESRKHKPEVSFSLQLFALFFDFSFLLSEFLLSEA